MLQLIAGSSSHSEPVVPIRWCLSPDIIEELSAKDAVHPHILLSIYNEEKREEVGRQLVPLEQAMAYVQFNHPGTNIVNAVIVWSNKPEILQKLLLEIGPGEFRASGLYSYYDEDIEFRPYRTLHFCEVRCLDKETGNTSIEVDDQFFAHEPKEWEKKWVNLWFKYQPRDQCEFRRRRILAYTFQPIAMLVAGIYLSMFRTVAFLFYGILGIRVTPVPIFHPFSMSRHDIWHHANLDGDFWNPRFHFFVRDSKGRDRPFGFWLLHPMHWFMASVILFWIWNQASAIQHKLYALAIAITPLAATCLLVAIIYELVIRFTRPEWRAKMKDDLETLRETRRALRQQQYYRESLADVTCGVGNFEPKVSALKKPRAVLLFQATKAAVCRPYRL